MVAEPTSRNIHTTKSPPVSHTQRPEASAPRPAPAAVAAAATTTASTAKSERYAFTVVDPKPTAIPG